MLKKSFVKVFLLFFVLIIISLFLPTHEAKATTYTNLCFPGIYCSYTVEMDTPSPLYPGQVIQAHFSMGTSTGGTIGPPPSITYNGQEGYYYPSCYLYGQNCLASQADNNTPPLYAPSTSGTHYLHVNFGWGLPNGYSYEVIFPYTVVGEGGGNNPNVTISANPTTVAEGNTTTVSWVTQFANGCYLKANGIQVYSGDGPYVSPPLSQNTYYLITCAAQFGFNSDNPSRLAESPKYLNKLIKIFSLTPVFADLVTEVQDDVMVNVIPTPLPIVNLTDTNGVHGLWTLPGPGVINLKVDGENISNCLVKKSGVIIHDNITTFPYEFQNSLSTSGTFPFRAECSGPGGTDDDNGDAIVLASPNLVASNPPQTSAYVGIPITFTSVISNIGDAGTGNSFPNIFQISSTPNGENPIPPPYLATPNPIGPLAVNGSYQVSYTHTFNTPGPYSVRACADNNTTWTSFVNEGASGGENNNCSGWVNVSVVPVTVSVTADPSYYNVAPSTSISFTYTATTNIGGTACLLEDYQHSLLTTYQPSSPIIYGASPFPGSYLYYIRCRNTLNTNIRATSNPITVNVYVNTVPTVTSPTATNVTTTTATLNANITSIGTPPLIARGFCYSYQTGNPSLQTPDTTCVSVLLPVIGQYSKNISGLISDKTYNFRGYAMNETGEGYTENATFDTLTTTGTINATDCSIPTGANSCTITLTWSIANATGTSYVESPLGTSLGLGYSTTPPATTGSKTRTLSYGTSIFYLYHPNLSTNGGTQLASDAGTAYCVLGTNWNSLNSKCEAGASGIISASNCTILSGQSACNSTINWNTSGATATVKVHSPNGTPLIGFTGFGPATKTHPITYSTPINNATTFYLHNGGLGAPLLAQATAIASCTPGTNWDGAKCAPKRVGLILATNCEISAGQGSCTTSLQFGIQSPLGPSQVTTPNQGLLPPIVVYEHLGTESFGPITQSYSPVEYPERTFYLYDAGTPLSQATAKASCVLGTDWNPITKKCESAITDPTGILSAEDCDIPAGENHCDSTLNWEVFNPILGAHTAVTTTPPDNTIVPGTEDVLSGSTTYPVERGSRSFFLYHNEVELDNASANAKCISGTVWDGEKCIANNFPDLVAGNVFPLVAQVSVPISFTANITNQGGVTTGATFSNIFQISSTADGGNPLQPPIASTPNPMPILPAGESATAHSVAYTCNTANTTFSVRACADNNTSWVGTITESEEGNNCSSVWRNVQCVDTSIDGICGIGYLNCDQGTPINGNYPPNCTWICHGSDIPPGEDSPLCSATNCGGPSCNFNGVQDEGETGIDCGGPVCPTCVKKPWWKEL